MANIKSQIKRNRTNEERRLRNKAVKSELKRADPPTSDEGPALPLGAAGPSRTRTPSLRDDPH